MYLKVKLWINNPSSSFCLKLCKIYHSFHNTPFTSSYKHLPTCVYFRWGARFFLFFLIYVLYFFLLKLFWTFFWSIVLILCFFHFHSVATTDCSTMFKMYFRRFTSIASVVLHSVPKAQFYVSWIICRCFDIYNKY